MGRLGADGGTNPTREPLRVAWGGSRGTSSRVKGGRRPCPSSPLRDAVLGGRPRVTGDRWHYEGRHCPGRPYPLPRACPLRRACPWSPATSSCKAKASPSCPRTGCGSRGRPDPIHPRTGVHARGRGAGHRAPPNRPIEARGSGSTGPRDPGAAGVHARGRETCGRCPAVRCKALALVRRPPCGARSCEGSRRARGSTSGRGEEERRNGGETPCPPPPLRGVSWTGSAPAVRSARRRGEPGRTFGLWLRRHHTPGDRR